MDNTGIYLKLIRTGETHSVALSPNFSAHVDDWFPDGSHLLVTREEHTRANTSLKMHVKRGYDQTELMDYFDFRRLTASTDR